MAMNTDSGIEELTSTGDGAGLEVEADHDLIKVPFDPKQIDVVTQARTIDLLLTRLRENELNLSPDFQRRANLWKEETKSGLIESLLLRIPIPSLYVSEDTDGNYTVVDGLQRLCAIAHFVDADALNKSVKTTLAPLRLFQLQSQSEFEGLTFSELPRQLQRRISETELTLHIIRASTPKAVKFNIFSRINRGGLPLTSQEIRNAIYAGDWRKHIAAMATSTEFLDATERRISTERMQDMELVLRFAASYSLAAGDERPPDQNLDEFLNSFVEEKSARWSDRDWRTVSEAFRRSMIYAPRVFGRVAFRKPSAAGAARRPINRGLFETEAVALARYPVSDLERLASAQDLVHQKLSTTFDKDKEFTNTLLYATGRGSSANRRLGVVSEILRSVLE